MKKLYSFFITLSLLSAAAFSEGYFMNRLGACSDADGTEFGKNLFVIDEDDKSDMHFADYAEFAYFWDMAEITAIFAINNAAFETPAENILAAGYGMFSPISFLAFAAGNDTRDRFSLSGGELYTENQAYILQSNPFADGAGIIFQQDFGDIGIMALASVGASKGAYLNAGAEVGYYGDYFAAAVQGTFQNILNKNEYYHYSIFGTASFADFDFSAGYISNYNDQAINDFDLDSVESQAYLPLPSSHVLKLSARYSNELFMIAFDGLTGLNKEYILNTESKKARAAYDAYVEHGYAPENEEDGELGKNENIPWNVSVKGGLFITDDISLYIKYSLGHGIDYNHVIYTYSDWSYSENSFFRLGACCKITGDKFSVSVPVMWQIKLDIK